MSFFEPVYLHQKPQYDAECYSNTFSFSDLALIDFSILHHLEIFLLATVLKIWQILVLNSSFTLSKAWSASFYFTLDPFFWKF